MNIVIRNSTDMPIYEQICSQIKDCIISGEMKSGDFLPSIRALAKDLRISVITTKRAYEELEKEGFIHTLQGKGSVVSERSNALIREENLKKIEEYIREIKKLSAFCGLTKEDLKFMFEEDNQCTQ